MIVTCPNCGDFIEILQINCAIFRHGVFKKTNTQINPHETKENCDLYKNMDLIYGCSKPFKIIIENEKIDTVICDYI